jgi:hypothetical protein
LIFALGHPHSVLAFPNPPIEAPQNYAKSAEGF